MPVPPHAPEAADQREDRDHHQRVGGGTRRVMGRTSSQSSSSWPPEPLDLHCTVPEFKSYIDRQLTRVAFLPTTAEYQDEDYHNRNDERDAPAH